MEQDRYMEMIVDSYDGNLDTEGERVLGEAMAADPSLREMYRLYGEALTCHVPVEEVDTGDLRRRIADGISFRRRAPLRRIVAALSAAVVIAAVVLTTTLSPRHDYVRVAGMTEVAVRDVCSDSCTVSEMACNVREESSVDDLTVARSITYEAARVVKVAEVVPQSVELREEFVLATPMCMIEVEYDPADMLCDLSEMPAIDAGHTRLSTSGGFADKLSDIIRMLR